MIRTFTKNHIILSLKMIVCTFLIFNVTGCWSRQEVDSISIVMGIGLDIAENSEQVRFTAQVFKPVEQKEGGREGGGGEVSFWNVESSGETVSSAVQSALHEAPRELYFSHNQIVIFGQNLAKNGILPHMDFFVREHSNRLTIQVLVAKNQAGEILATPAHLEKMPALDMRDLIEAQTEVSQSGTVNLKQIMTRLMSTTTAPIAPLIEVSEQGSEQTVRLSGTAVFKKDKLVGELDQRETRGMLWVLGEVRRGVIEVACPESGGKVALITILSKPKVVPVEEHGKVKIIIDVKEEGILGSQSCPENFSSPEKNKQLEEMKADAIHQEIRKAITKAQELNADIFGFGDAVHRKYPKLWKQLEQDWDTIFPDMEIDLAVETIVRNEGRASEPLTEE
ncbi:spore germination protein KC [Evansella caseinilytica]|uniref:Spore germination protein KC n=1 Tax=Evansella caseinilytica TaxID=1503961 RepID=A0A1H3UYZ5_9BACI|nr:Ger(x)C family spore germination protein [Evansella caseinilytica]SDZ67664.1 spore germination protein KC [Evansella caseinilytica]